MRPDNDATGPQMKLRPNHSDNLYDLQLLRDLQIISERTQRELGSLPVGGLPVQPKRKPQQPRPAVPPVTPALPPSDEDTMMQWKSVAAVAALATGSTLAACGAESTAAHVDPPAAAVPGTPASVQMPAVEAAPPAAQAAVAEPGTLTDSKASEPVRGPAIPAAQLRRQILALLRSFEKLEDLERDNVGRSFGARLTKMQGMSEGYEYDGITSEGWQYGISTAKLGRLDEPSSIIVGMDYGFDYDNNLPPNYCTLAFEPLAKELVAMGYAQDNEIAKFKGDVWWNFEKRIPQSKTAVFAMVYLYRPTNTKDEGYCIGSIKIQGDVIDG